MKDEIYVLCIPELHLFFTLVQQLDAVDEPDVGRDFNRYEEAMDILYTVAENEQPNVKSSDLEPIVCVALAVLARLNLFITLRSHISLTPLDRYGTIAIII